MMEETMQELIKNFIYLGAGAAFATKEKIETVKNELVEKGKMTQDEGKQFVDDLMNKSEKAKEELETKIREMVAEQLDKTSMATKDDIADLQKQILELRKMLEKTRKSSS